MQVKLLACTPDPEALCALAAQNCYSKHTTDERTKNGKILTPTGVQNMLNRVIRSGHHSTIEHASFTFAIEGVSRSLLAQITRHRIASFSVMSQRYVKLDEPSFVTPPSMAECATLWNGNYGAIEEFEMQMRNAWESYNKLLKMGIPAEDARYVLPNACTTNIIMTMNGRELLHFLSLRCCNRTQWELREVAWEIHCQLMEVAPEIFKHAGPSCWNGGCTEDEPCGNPPKKPKVE